MLNNIEQVESFINAYNHLFGLFELTPEPILVANKNGVACYCNSIFYKLFGYEASEIIGKPVEVLMPERYRSHHPALLNKFWEHPVKRPMGTGVQPIGLKQNGDEIHLDISLSPIGDELVLCVLKDVTEMIHSKNQQQQYSQLNTMGLLTASLIHEISNPVQTIYGVATIIKDYLLKSNADPYMTAKIDDIDYAGKQLVELISTFRKLMKNDQQEDGQEIGSVSDAIEIAKRLCAHKLRAINFKTDLPPEFTDTVPLSTSKLAQILINLYANASFSISEAGVKNAQLLTEVYNPDQDTVQIKVSDTGTGVPDNLREKIFDPMFSTKKFNQGTGLGLSICRDMLRQVDGDINLVASDLSGACFEINLPTAKLA